MANLTYFYREIRRKKEATKWLGDRWSATKAIGGPWKARTTIEGC